MKQHDPGEHTPDTPCPLCENVYCSACCSECPICGAAPVVTVSVRRLITEAQSLLEPDETGNNPEYERALVELIYWATGVASRETVEQLVLRERWCD